MRILIIENIDSEKKKLKRNKIRGKKKINSKIIG